MSEQDDLITITLPRSRFAVLATMTSIGGAVMMGSGTLPQMVAACHEMIQQSGNNYSIVNEVMQEIVATLRKNDD